MKRFLFIVVVAALSTFFYIMSPEKTAQSTDAYAETQGQLLVPQRNVAIAVVDLQVAGLSFTSGADMVRLRRLQDDFQGLQGVSKVESILSATRVIAEGEDIIISRAIPSDEEALSDEYLTQLESELDDFPELSPYVAGDRNTLLFYVYFTNKSTSIDVYHGMSGLQAKWETELPFDFTGQGPIIAETERLLTKDIVIFFPLLFLMVLVIFGLFRSLKAMVAALCLIAVSVGAAYGFVRFMGIQDSPLLLLIPVFSLGLLSDYSIHYFYHHFHVSRLDEKRGPRKALMFPLSLTAISTVTGFISLSLINGSGHLQVGLVISIAVVVTWIGLFFWLDYGNYPAQSRELMVGFQRAQAKLFARIAGHRHILFGFIALGILWGGVQLGKLSIEPYPIEQLPDTTTVKKADLRINESFYGTVPFFIEVDTGEKLGILHKDSLLALQDMHELFARENIGYAFSVLSVLKRMNFYFMGDEASLLEGNQFDDMYDTLIEQYLLYYSSGVDPLDYESLLDNSYRIFSIKGLAYYRNYQDLDHFNALIKTIESNLPVGWSLKVHGMVSQLAEEQYKLANNWILSFLGGSLLIFFTVLLYYRKLRMALLSLIPGVISMVISFGFIGMAGISIDAFSIIFVAIITGLVIDYSIHTLTALEKIPEIKSLEDGFSQIMGYSGIPIFLSFTTSILSFSVLFLSSFQGARSLGFLLFTSLVLSFFLSLYLLPLLVLPGRILGSETGENNA
jgi:hypothetical protein